MNAIIRENYPVSKLPKDLREEVIDSEVVRLTIEPVEREANVLPLEELFEQNAKLRAQGKIQPRSREEVMARVRALRDSWDD